jgi:hypothetical protein
MGNKSSGRGEAAAANEIMGETYFEGWGARATSVGLSCHINFILVAGPLF